MNPCAVEGGGKKNSRFLKVPLKPPRVQGDVRPHNHMKTESEEFLPTRWSLIKRLKNWDDQESWRDFFDSYWRLIHATAIKSGLTEVEAQEVVQETIISVSKSMEKFRADPSAGSFKAWLMNLTRWRITDQARKRRPDAAGQGEEDDTGHTSRVGRIPDPAGVELERIWNEEWRDNLTAAALERVQHQSKAKHYQAFYLYVIRGAPVERVAKVTGVNPQQVYLLKHRLMPLFEKALKEVENGQQE